MIEKGVRESLDRRTDGMERERETDTDKMSRMGNLKTKKNVVTVYV